MRRIAAVLVLTLPAFAADLQQQIEAIAREHHGKVALYARHLKTGASVALNPDTPVKTASVIKLPIMIEAFTQARAGKLRLDDKLTLSKENQIGRASCRERV